MTTLDKINAKIQEIKAIVMEACDNGENVGAFLVAAQGQGEGYQCEGSTCGMNRAQVLAVVGAMKQNRHNVDVVLKAAEVLHWMTQEERDASTSIGVKPNSTKS